MQESHQINPEHDAPRPLGSVQAPPATIADVEARLRTSGFDLPPRELFAMAVKLLEEARRRVANERVHAECEARGPSRKERRTKRAKARRAASRAGAR